MPVTAPTKTPPNTDDRRPTDAELMNADGRRVSEADYWAYYYEFADAHYEWNNGRLEEKPVSDNLTIWIYHWLSSLLEADQIAAALAIDSDLVRRQLADG